VAFLPVFSDHRRGLYHGTDGQWHGRERDSNGRQGQKTDRKADENSRSIGDASDLEASRASMPTWRRSRQSRNGSGN